MAYWQDEIFKQVNVQLHAPSGAKSRSSTNDVGKPHEGHVFFPYHSDKMLAKLSWREWVAMRKAQSMLGRLPRMKVTDEYQPKPLAPLPVIELNVDGSVILKSDGRIALVRTYPS